MSITPVLPSQTAPDPTSRSAKWVPALALLVVTTGAFLLASTPARNSDFWLRLATGRAVVTGTAEFGTDPFAYTTAGVRWVNASWLSCVLLYWGYTAFGGAAVVAVKAALFALTFALVFVTARGRGPWAGAAAAAGLGAVASGVVSPVRPVAVSYFLLALTLWLLLRPTERSPWRAYGVLLPLFALWANLDEWFFLGPVVLAVVAAGRAAGGGRASARAWLLLAAAGFAACLVNPYLHRVFRLPPDVGLLGVPEPLRSEPGVRDLDARAYALRFVRPPGLPVNPGAVAFWVLGAAAAASLLLPARLPRGARAALWVLFFGLGVVHVRAAPFAAIGTAVLAGLPFREAALGVRRRVVWPAAAVAAVAFLGAAWTGWLQVPPYGARTWAIEPDPTLRAAAAEVVRLRASGALPEGARVFPLSVEAAHYLVWFAPGERVFLDSRWELYGGAADRYELLRQWLTAADERTRPDGAAVLRDYRIAAVLVSDPNPGVRNAAVGRLVGSPADWTLLNVSGRSALFGRNGDGRSFAPDRLDLDRLAFDPALVRPAPERAADPGPPRWYDAFVRPPSPPRILDRDEADLDVTLFDAVRSTRRVPPQRLGATAVGSFAGLAAAGAGPLGRPIWTLAPAYPIAEIGPADRAAAEVASAWREAIGRDAARGPLAPLLLAVRAGRRAAAEYPRDAAAQLALGEAYDRLRRATRDAAWARELPELSELRRIQMVTAMARAARLDPDLLSARLALYGLFLPAAPDLALDELTEVVRLTRTQTDPDAGARLRAFEDEREALAERVARLRGRLPAARDALVAARAEAAVGLGLYGEALQLLLKADYAALGDRGVQLEVEALLTCGRAADVLDWIKPVHRDALGDVGYHWALARAAAGVGDYDAFDAQLIELGSFLGSVSTPDGTRAGLRPVVARTLGRTILLGGVCPASPTDLILAGLARPETVDLLVRSVGGLRQVAKGAVLRGLMKMERGDVRGAAELFRDTLGVWGSEDAAASGAGIDFPGRRLAEDALELLRFPK